MFRRLLLVVAASGLLWSADWTSRPTPEWVRSSVIYEINTRAFSPTHDFRGIEAKLPDLQQLGVNVLWLMPIHPVGHLKKKGTLGSPYSVRDYNAINPDFGTADDLKHLVKAAHERGMKVILDTVPNHTSWDSVMMTHPDFYKHGPDGKIIPPNPDWDDVAALNYGNPQLRSYMIGMWKHWITDFDVDGFRCDVAFGPPVDFWDEARPELEKVQPGVLMLAESHVPELLVKDFDLDYAWPFHSTLTDVFENGAPASTLRMSWETERKKYPMGAMEMRFSDNHDEKRAIARFGERGALAASALVFTMDGVPMLYNGMEVGDTTESGAPALFEPLQVFWGIGERRPEFRRFYTQMIALRKEHPALQQGETEWLGNSDESRVLTYMRKSGDEQFLVAINCSNRPFSGTVAASGSFAEVTPDFEKKATPAVEIPKIALDAWGFRIYRKK